MFRATLLLVLAAAARADVSCADPKIPAETLGNEFESLGVAADEFGLMGGVWNNLLLHREEFWHNTDSGEWFLRKRKGLYVLAARNEASGEWRTDPRVRLVRSGAAWKRVTLK